MFKIIQAKDKHVDQLVPLLSSTGYWDFGLKDNLLNISNRELMREAVVKPYLPFTNIITKNENDDHVLGAVVCSSKEAISKMPGTEYDSQINPLVTHHFKNLFNFEITDSYHVSFLAVANTFRGQGLGKKLLEYAENKGKLEGCETLSLYTASCQTSAIKLYHHFGMMITQIVTVSNRVPFSHFLYFEKNRKIMSKHDFFDTEEYQNLSLNLLNEEN